MKTHILHKVFAHYYRSGRVGLLFVILSSRAGKPLRLDIAHEAHPTLEQSDASEFRRVVVSALSEAADVFNLEFSVAVPSDPDQRRIANVRFRPRQRTVPLAATPWHIHHSAAASHKCKEASPFGTSTPGACIHADPQAQVPGNLIGGPDE
jgi:hypothetical protein